MPGDGRWIRRGRGALLRLVRHRGRSVGLGLALAAPAAWIEFGGRSVPWWVDAVALILGATGVALVWAGVAGSKPDWIE